MVPKVVLAVAVVVTKSRLQYWLLAVLLLTALSARAAILPEDRADVLFHSYDGGGVTIEGPSILVRKQIGDDFSVYGNYYVDTVTSASIDVVATASPYTEERTEYGTGVDYLRDNVTLSASYTQSEENDFLAKSMHFGVSQEVFGGLTTVSLGYSRGWDEVGIRDNDVFEEEAEREHYRIGLSQIITKNMIMQFNVEGISDEGYLNNPYRSVRYVNAADPKGFTYEPELYPNTRTSLSIALRGKYYLPYRAAIHAEYRNFSDTWGIKADTFEIGYTHPFLKNWIADFRIRSYAQTQANFYSDLFASSEEFTQRGRDKELSTFSSFTVGAGISYEFAHGWGFVDKASVNLSYDHIQFDYDNFHDATLGFELGEEPLYSFDADVIQFFVSVWY